MSDDPTDLADKVKQYLGLPPHSNLSPNQYQGMVKEYGKATVDLAVRTQAMSDDKDDFPADLKEDPDHVIVGANGELLEKEPAKPPQPYIAQRDPALPVGRAASPAELLQIAVERGATVEEIDKFMDLVERADALDARKAYNRAMAQFKADAPAIFKERKVQFDTTNDGETAYKHASLGNVCNVIVSSLGKYGLSHRWEMAQAEGQITVTCIITHELGHSERTSLTAGPDTSGKKNAIQAVASTVSYLERYTVLGGVGMAAQDQDDDGMAAGVEYLTEEEAANIQTLLDEITAPNYITFFLRNMKAASIAEIRASKYELAIKALEQKRGNR